VLKRRALCGFWYRKYLHHQITPHEVLRGFETRANSILDELRAEIAGLISHEMVLIYALAEPTGRGSGSARANSLVRLPWIENSVDAVRLRQALPTLVVEQN
jgi:hypothetical protein